MKTKALTIPKFKTLAEEAKFWDTHDITDYWDEMKEVKLEFIDNSTSKKDEVIAIRVNPKLKERLQKISQNQGISLSDLARIWFIEKIRQF